MLIDILYIIGSLALIGFVSVVLAKREKRMKQRISDIKDNSHTPYKRMVGSTKAKLARDIKRVQRKTRNQTDEIKKTDNGSSN